MSLEGILTLNDFEYGDINNDLTYSSKAPSIFPCGIGREYYTFSYENYVQNSTTYNVSNDPLCQEFNTCYS